MDNMEQPKKETPNVPQEGVTPIEARNEKEKRDPDLQAAKNFLKENDEKIGRAVVSVSEAFKKAWKESARVPIDLKRELDSALSTDEKFFGVFQKDPVIQELFSKYNAGQDATKALLYRSISEKFDQSLGGGPEQILVRRILLRPTISEIRDDDGERAASPEAFKKLLKDRGLNTMGSDSVGNKEVESFLEEVSKSKDVAAALKSDLSDVPALFRAFENGKTKLTQTDIAKRLLQVALSPELVTLKLLHTRLKYEEKNVDMATRLEDSVDKLIEKHGPQELRFDRDGQRRKIVNAILD